MNYNQDILKDKGITDKDHYLGIDKGSISTRRYKK